MSLLCRGWGGCVLQVHVGVVRELRGCFGGGRPLHMCSRGPGGRTRACVVGCRRHWGRAPLRTAPSTSVC